MISSFRKVNNYLATLSTKPEDDPDTRAVKRLLPRNFLLFIILFLTLGLMHIHFHEPLAGSIYCSAGILSLINAWVYVSFHKNYRIAAPLAGVIGLSAICATTILLGGIFNSGGAILWGIFVVMMSLIGLSVKRARIVLIVYISLFVLLLWLEPVVRTSNNLPQGFISFLFAFTVICISILIFNNLAYFIEQRNIERQKVEDLLLNVLPKDIAAILKDEQRAIADQFNMASILFADVVNFTPMSAQMTAEELVDLLNEVFSYFDALVEKYGLEKIKTVGDCYMVAAGVPKLREDHAKVLVEMALDIRAYTTRQTFNGRQLTFRIGINSGPVVAGVIGRKKFIYDLWGDTVNTASRMESHSMGNVIQITKETYDLIKDDFVCESRGVINVKGKGEMETWYVLDRKTNSA